MAKADIYASIETSIQIMNMRDNLFRIWGKAKGDAFTTQETSMLASGRRAWKKAKGLISIGRVRDMRETGKRTKKMEMGYSGVQTKPNMWEHLKETKRMVREKLYF